MEFKKIMFKNVFAYGEKVNTIEYQKDGCLMLVSGKSGAGKSAILSLPMLLIYGKSDKIPKNAIANRINKNGWIGGEIVSNGHEYAIERTFNPSSLKIWKDGKDLENYGINDAQSFILNEVVDIPQQVFSNIITVSMRRFKSFLTMNPYDKKMIIDIVFSLDQLNKLYEMCKDDIKKVGDNINASNSAFFALNKTLDQSVEELKRASASASTVESEKMKENVTKIEELTAKKAQVLAAYETYSKQSNDSRAAVTAEQKKLHEVEALARQIKQKIDLFNHDKCPTCGSSFTSSQFDEVKQKLKEAETKVSEQRESFISKINELNETNKTLSDALEKLSSALSAINSQVAALAAENKTIENIASVSSQLKGIQNIIDKTKSEIEATQKIIDDDNTHMDDLQKLLLVYSADGAKEKIINTYLPLFNKSVAQHLEALNFPYFVTFDTKFNATVREYNVEIPVESLSDGEMTRADLAIICALFKVLKHKFPTINIFHLDEILSTLDPETSNIMLEFLREFARDEKLNIIIVSHVDMNLEMFDKCISVQKHNGFSEISE